MGTGTEGLGPKTRGGERSPDSEVLLGSGSPPSSPLHIGLTLTWKSSTWSLDMAGDEAPLTYSGNPWMLREEQPSPWDRAPNPGKAAVACGVTDPALD